MSITGGVKFFYNNYYGIDTNGTVVASSGTISQSFCLDENKYTYWEADETINGTVTLTFSGITEYASTSKRIFLIDHNFESFEIKKLSGTAYQTIANVIKINGTLSNNIIETTNNRTTSYYEFSHDDVITGYQISITKTIDDEAPYLCRFILTEEIGTLVGFPTIKNIVSSRNLVSKETISGKKNIQKSIDDLKFTLDFNNYPNNVIYNVDIDLLLYLQDYDFPFLSWLCGGREGLPYFNYQLPAFRTKDLLKTQITNDLNLSYSKGLYKAGLNVSVNFEEVV